MHHMNSVAFKITQMCDYFFDKTKAQRFMFNLRCEDRKKG